RAYGWRTQHASRRPVRGGNRRLKKNDRDGGDGKTKQQKSSLERGRMAHIRFSLLPFKCSGDVRAVAGGTSRRTLAFRAYDPRPEGAVLKNRRPGSPSTGRTIRPPVSGAKAARAIPSSASHSDPRRLCSGAPTSA